MIKLIKKLKIKIANNLLYFYLKIDKNLEKRLKICFL